MDNQVPHVSHVSQFKEILTRAWGWGRGAHSVSQCLNAVRDVCARGNAGKQRPPPSPGPRRGKGGMGRWVICAPPDGLAHRTHHQHQHQHPRPGHAVCTTPSSP